MLAGIDGIFICSAGYRAIEDEHGYLEQIRQALYGLGNSFTSGTASSTTPTDSAAISSKETTSSKADSGASVHRMTDASTSDRTSDSFSKATLDSEEEGPDEIKKKV